MKNPFLEDRNIFSKVPKPAPKSNQDQKQGQTLPERKTQYQPKYNIKPQIQSNNYNPSPSNQHLGRYQRQAPNYSSTQPNITANKYMSSQKITFGDPMSSQAYNADRTSGYFNMPNSQQANNKPTTQNKYDNLKYEPRKNNFFEAQNKNMGRQSFTADLNMKETRKQFGKGYLNYQTKTQEIKLDYEFAPPPINNFTTTQPMENKYQANNYEYKSSYGNNQQRPSYNAGQQNSYQGPKDSFAKQTNFMQRNPYTASTNIYKSPPKQSQLPVTPKHDISARFKENNYAQFSPIGEVSRHKINEDSIMNLDGLMDCIELDKLLAESKTQEELLKILGMDASMIKKSPDSGNKNRVDYEPKYQNHDAKPQVSPYVSQNQNQFAKKSYQPQPMMQVNQPKYQNFRDQEEQPQVFNYGQSYAKYPVQQSRQNPIHRSKSSQSPQKLNKPSSNAFQDSEHNFFAQSQTLQQRTSKHTPMNQNKSEQQQYDLQKIMQREMQKFMSQQEGFSRDKRVFMTANEKIITKKYKLQSL